MTTPVVLTANRRNNYLSTPESWKASYGRTMPPMSPEPASRKALHDAVSATGTRCSDDWPSSNGRRSAAKADVSPMAPVIERWLPARNHANCRVDFVLGMDRK